MFNNELDRDFVERALRFANMREEEITDARVVEEIFGEHPYRRERALLWRQIEDPGDVAGLRSLRNDLRNWLRTIKSDNWEDNSKLRAEILRRYKEKSTERARIDFDIAEGPHRIDISLWGLPDMDFDDRGRLIVSVVPLLTGVESAVYFAVLLIYTASDDRRLIGECEAPLPNRLRLKLRCGKFFMRTKERRAACSAKCYKLHRKEYVNKKVRAYWEGHPRRAQAKRVKAVKGRKREQGGDATKPD